MTKPNPFETQHLEKLKTAEEAALDALTQIAKGSSTKTVHVDTVRIEAAKAILQVRSDDA